MDDQPPIVKRGRKNFNSDLTEFLKDNRAISFNPSYFTRENMVYCMKETGIYNKSQIVALAIKNYNDMLLAEAKRRQQISDHDALKTINTTNFTPSRK